MRTVLLFSWFYLPYVGGSELFVRAITRRLRDRFRFVIVTARADRGLARSAEEDGTRIVRVGVGAGIDKFLYPLPALRAALAVPSVDLVHAVMENAAALTAYGYLRFRRRPSLLTMQSGDSEEYVRSYLGPFFPFYRRLHRPFDRVHAISSFLRDRAVGYGADPRSISIIPNGVDLETFSPEAWPSEALDSLRSRLGLVGKRVVVSVSRLALKNNVEALIRAFALLRKRKPEARLLLVGDGEDRSRLEALVRELGLAADVVFAGTVIHEETPRYLRIADVFARPSLSEGLGTAFLEAMACGVPVVASPVGGIPDFLEDERTGLLCRAEEPESIASALERLLEDAALAARLGRNGREMVESRYGWDGVAERIGALYDELLAT